MIIKQKPIMFINDCKCSVDMSVLEEAMLWYADSPVQSIKHIYMHGNYPAISIKKQKLHIHRLIAMYIQKEIFPRLLVVHHKDGNRLNATVKNLEIISSGHHGRLHNKGKTLSLEHRKKIGDKNRNRKGCTYPNRRQINIQKLQAMLNDGQSINSCSKHFGVDWSTIKKRIHDNPELLKEPADGKD